MYKKLLLSTNELEIEEGNVWGDTYWGVCRGIGANRLGKILMKVRQEIRDPIMATRKALFDAIEEYGWECCYGNEYDNKRAIAQAMEAVKIALADHEKKIRSSKKPKKPKSEDKTNNECLTCGHVLPPGGLSISCQMCDQA